MDDLKNILLSLSWLLVENAVSPRCQLLVIKVEDSDIKQINDQSVNLHFTVVYQVLYKPKNEGLSKEYQKLREEMGATRDVGSLDTLLNDDLVHRINLVGRLSKLTRIFVDRAIGSAHS